ncbi:chromosomal replication initiator protein DnaA [Advenella mimigardefordensis]|uniref:Chromosomal replication initiator protein DnaA n=1 Tax=Advenella mimigardefordensis (strain DSM 17166 / LMG 22922 / DPN7) TaxID=1247726 RepID=W0P5G9_ADVMD|nr:chromosomal replication initiator protein DnaA [Advenella mimigardefordensis]AHG62104.1 chromosomal replication initiator protein DnaA [Advenella mimigardefordensis DPN7]
MQEFWQSCVHSLAQELPPEQMKAWVHPLSFLSFDEELGEVRVSAPNAIKQNWARTNYTQRIQELASNWFNRPGIRVIFQVARRDQHHVSQVHGPAVAPPAGMPAVAPAGAPAPREYTNGSVQPNGHGASAALHTAARATAVVEPAVTGKEPTVVIETVGQAPEDHVYKRSHMNANLTFESLVIGKSNQLANAASAQIVENPGVSSYNPFFLYGSTGLGKTHLMHAIGNALFKAGKVSRVRYIHADQYYSDMVKSFQTNTFDDLKRYYHSLDLLLIDDIQFFRKKERTQEEFFLLYETMVQRGRQIVITSDTYPRELQDINSRLTSRFDSGLTVQIEPPELEMRVAILLRKAEEKTSIVLKEEAAFFIAKHLRSNVRELEGALSRVSAYAGFHGVKIITVEFCKEALKDLLSVSIGQITIENIQKTVADFYKLKVQEMYSKRRPANIAMARQIAMYLAKELTQKSLPEIGDSFGGRDHTTVLHAVRKITEQRAKNAELNHQLHVLEQTLKG